MYDMGVIRKATITDLPRIIDLERKCFHIDSAYTPYQLRYLITRANSTCLIKDYQDIIQGCIIVLFRRGTGVAGIETINVHPQHRSKGIGAQLLIHAEQEMSFRRVKKIRLEVSVGNTAAIQLYQKSGFRITTLLKGYYKNTQYGSNEAYRMVKQLAT